MFVLFVPAPISPNEKIEFFTVRKSLFPVSFIIYSIPGHSLFDKNKKEVAKIANEQDSIELLTRKKD